MEVDTAKHYRSTLMQRIVQLVDIADGVVDIRHIPGLLKRLKPDADIDTNEISKLTAKFAKNGSGLLDFDSLTRVIFHILMKQSSRSTHLDDPNIYNHDEAVQLSVSDFIIFPSM